MKSRRKVKDTVDVTLASQGSTWSKVWKNSYVKTAVLIVIIIGGVVGFWYGLQAGLRTQFPLLTVASGSMVPTLNVGDLIVVQGITDFASVKAGLWQTPNEGDIIVFHDPRYGSDELIVHRVVIRELGSDGLWYFQTQGDHNEPVGVLRPDSWGNVSQNLVIGRVVGRVPWIGYVPLYIRTPSGVVIIIVLFLIIVLAELIPSTPKKPEAKQG